MALNTIPVMPDQKRDASAAILAQTAHTWPIVTLKRAWGAFPKGACFLAAPSSSGGRYLVNTVACECPDYQKSGNVCKHIRTVLLLDAQNVTPKPSKSYADLFPICLTSACQDDPEPGEAFCWRHALVDAF